MKFVCDKNMLVQAITAVQRAVAAKSPVKALEGIHINAKGSSIVLTGFNTDIGITATIDCPVQEQGELVADAKLLGDIIRKLPSDSAEISADEKYRMTIIGGNTVVHISAMNAEEYPDLPKAHEETPLVIQQSVLKGMIRQTLFAVSDSEIKPIHTGTLFELNSDCIRLVSVDGFRLAVREEPVQCPKENTFVVPGKTLNELIRILDDDGTSTVTIHTTLRHILFVMDNMTVVSKLIEGEFLDYKSTLPKESATEVRIKTHDFVNSLDRVSLIISDRLKSPVHSEFADNELRIFCETPVGRINDRMDITLEGSPIEIGFNNRFMLEALRNTECDEIKIMMNTPLSPILIRPVEGNSFTFLVLPVRLKAD